MRWRQAFVLFAVALGIHSIQGCRGRVSNGEATLTRASAWRMAERFAKQSGIPLDTYKRDKGIYLPDKNYWCMTYEERGYFLAVGHQFAVLIDGGAGEARIVDDVGWGNVARAEKLEQELAGLKTVGAGEGRSGLEPERTGVE